jgi:hypothetical protein
MLLSFCFLQASDEAGHRTDCEIVCPEWLCFNLNRYHDLAREIDRLFDGQVREALFEHRRNSFELVNFDRHAFCYSFPFIIGASLTIPNQMLLDPIIQRSAYTVLQGASGSGKTRFIMQLIAALQQPCPDLFGLTGQPNLKIALMTCDQPVSVYETNAQEAGVDLTQIKWHAHQALDSRDTHRRFGGSERFEYFIFTMAELYRDHAIDLFIVEPFSTWLAIDLNNYEKSAARLAELNYWLGQRHCGMIGTVHQTIARDNYRTKRAKDRIHACPTMHGHSFGTIVLDLATEILKNPANSVTAKLTIDSRHSAEQVIWIDRDTISGCWKLSNNQKTLKSGPSVRQVDLLAFITAKAAPVFRRVLKADWMPSAGIKEASLDRDLEALVGFGLLTRSSAGYVGSQLSSLVSSTELGSLDPVQSALASPATTP